MPNKVKPTWICQHCTRPFTTKYSLMRHFKRFPEHAPPNLGDGSDDVKPVTVTLDDGIRTVRAGPSAMAQSSSLPPTTTRNVSATTPHHHYYYSSRRISTDGTEAMEEDPQMTVTAAQPPGKHTLPVVEPTPLSSSCDFGTPITDDLTDGDEDGRFPFLPRFLEEEQILDIATPMHHKGTPHHLSASISTPAALPLHMMAADTLQSPLWPGETMLSPLAPACNIAQVFTREHLKPTANSPLELEALNHNLMVGEDEVTSPLNFLEKMSSYSNTSSLDFLSPPQREHQRPMETHSTFDFGFAPMV